MDTWFLLIISSLVGSLISLIGGMLLLAKKLSERTVQLVAVPFAAGALLAVAFLDLLPESLEGEQTVLVTTTFVLCGFVIFFVLERFLGWFHHHHGHDAPARDVAKRRSVRSLVVVGDTVHNAIDGMVIGAAFLADPVLGVVTTIAIAAHEIPQEIGDFAVLLSLGMRRKSVLLVNIASALITVVVAAAVYGLGSSLGALEPLLLAVAAGMFIYIAASDLIPTIHNETNNRVTNYQTLILLGGIVFVGTTTMIAHQTLSPHVEDSHEQDSHLVE